MPRDIMLILFAMNRNLLPSTAPARACALVLALVFAIPPNADRFNLKELFQNLLAPTDELTLGLVYELVASGLIEARGAKGSLFSNACALTAENTEFLLCFDNSEQLLADLVDQWLGTDSLDSDIGVGLPELIKSTVVAEIVANIRHQLPFDVMTNVTPVALEALAIERSILDSFMLTWIAIQNFSPRDIRMASLQLENQCSFMTDIAEQIYYLHLTYKKNGRAIKEYILPKRFSPSSVSYIISKMLNRKNMHFYSKKCPWNVFEL